MLRLAICGCAAYQLNWFDAHLWSYAEHYGLAEIFSEDLQHDRLYGTLRVVNPFVELWPGMRFQQPRLEGLDSASLSTPFTRLLDPTRRISAFR